MIVACAPLRGPLNDVEALSDIFGDPDWGDLEVRAFRDATSGEIKSAIEEELGLPAVATSC